MNFIYIRNYFLDRANKGARLDIQQFIVEKGEISATNDH